MSRLKSLIFVAACLCSSFAHAAYVYEAGALSPGDTPLTLNSGGLNNESFSAVLRQGVGSPSVGVIFLHGRGEETYDGHVILPLRLELNALGYTTLSIDTPVPAASVINPNPFDYENFRADAGSGGANYVFPELYSRVRAAADELLSLGISQAVLVGFSMGSRLGSAYLSYGAAGPIPIIGYIGVGMGSDGLVSLLDSPTSLAGVNVPVLDLYGEFDNNSVLFGAADRMSTYSGPSYTQFQQSGADHQWVGEEDQLIANVTPWITSLAPIPEPEIYAMMGLGLGLMGWAARRRKLQAA